MARLRRSYHRVRRFQGSSFCAYNASKYAASSRGSRTCLPCDFASLINLCLSETPLRIVIPLARMQFTEHCEVTLGMTLPQEHRQIRHASRDIRIATQGSRTQ
ncbi:protein of unknown function [Pararobbsia alpina]